MEFEIVNEMNLNIAVRKNRVGQDLHVVNDVIRKDNCYRFRDVLYPRLKNLGVNTIVDCGGHIGNFGMLVKPYFPQARLIAIEPNRDSAELYQMNMTNNNFENTKVINAGLSYDKSKNTVILSSDDTAISLLVSEEEAKKAQNRDYENSWSLIGFFADRFGGKRTYEIDAEKIPTYTMEEIIENEQIQEIDILKLDCEGAEIGMLLNCTKETLEKAKIILCEWHYVPGGKSLYQQCKDKFVNFNLMDNDLSAVKWTHPDLFSVGYFMAVRKDINF